MTRKRHWMRGSVRRPGKLREDMDVPESMALHTDDILSRMLEGALLPARLGAVVPVA